MNDCNKIKEIIDEIEHGNDENAINLFEVFLNSISDFSEYSEWSRASIEKIYELGTLFQKKNPDAYFKKLWRIYNENENKREAIDFIYSEIAWNYFAIDKDFLKEQLKSFKKKYPLNPEFYHTYSHILFESGSYKESIQILEQAIRMDPCDRFAHTYINRIRNSFNMCVSKNKIIDAEMVLKSASNTFNNNLSAEKFGTYRNILTQIMDRLNDHKIIAEKISKIDDIIARRTEALRNRFISMLGVFAAIIAFILTTVNIAISNLKVKEIMLLMFAMADVLIIFSLSIDYVFYIRKKRNSFFEFLGDKQFWGIVVLLLILYLLFKLV